MPSPDRLATYFFLPFLPFFFLSFFLSFFFLAITPPFGLIDQ